MKALQQVNHHHLHHETHWEILSPEEAPPSLEEGMPPLNPSFEELACILHQCRKERNLTYALHLHAYMCENGLEAHPSIGNCLVSMFVEIGSMCHAQQVFERLVHRDESSWNSLIVGYVKHGTSQHALTLYQKMQEDDSVHANGYAFVALLKACATLKDLETGYKLHAEVDRKGLLEHDVFVCSTLVDMYAKCGSLAKAQEAFDKLQVRNVVTWNALLTGYAEHGHGEEALNCFEQMQHEGFCPSAVTLVCILKACGVVGAAVKGSEIHAEIARKGFLERNVFVGSTLVDMYANCGSLTTAQEVFDKLPVRDVVSWNALISGYVEHGRGEEALYCFDQMQHEGISPSAVTFVCGLKACGSIGAMVKGQEIHTEIVRKGLEKELLVGSTLVDMNSKCGLLAEAQEVFDELQVRDVVSWTALISGYAEHGRGDEALFCFEKMQHEGISPDAVALVCSLTSCGSIGASVKGQEIHAEIARKGLERELLIGNTLVDMYAECGSLATAQEVFDKLPFRDLVSWNALIAGYAQLGESENVFHIFDRMVGEGLKPDLVTIVSVLNACSHAGLVDKGQMYLQTISDDYGVTPTLEHYSCMVDLLGRAGHIDKAVAMMKKMPFHPGITLWHTVLGACRKWGNVELGRHAFEHAVRLDEKDAAAYVCMFNIYADAVMQENGHMVKAMRMKEKAWRKPGHSWWADGQDIIHLFSVGNQRRPEKTFMAS